MGHFLLLLLPIHYAASCIARRSGFVSAKLCCCGAGAVPLQSHEIVSQRDNQTDTGSSSSPSSFGGSGWRWWSLCFIKFVYDCRITNCRKNAEFVNWLCVCVCVGGWARRIFWAKRGGCSNKQWILIISIRTNHPPYTPWPWLQLLWMPAKQ